MLMGETTASHVSPAAPDREEGHHAHLLHGLMLGTALAAGALILTPYVLPALGIGSAETAMTAMTALHGTGLGVGLAGAINTGLDAVPFVGHTLAQGGIAAAAASGAIGIGGVLLGKFIEKKRDGKTGINWGRVITFGALATSALVALPSVLAGISVGIAYLAMAFSNLNLAAFSSVDIAGKAVTMMRKTLGATGTMSVGGMGLSGAAAALPHLLLCGGALLPAAFSFKLAGKTNDPHASSAHKKQIPANTQIMLQTQGSCVIASLEVDKPTAANIPAMAKLRLTDARTGLPITNDELAVTHTRKLHLYVTDQSLKEYHHIHPHPTGEPGVFAFSFTPRTFNQYNAWADFTLMNNGSNQRLKMEIPSAVKRNIPAVIRGNAQAEQGDLVFNWKNSEPLRKDTASIVEVDVTDRQGNAVTDLEPVMGAFAHLSGFSADGKHFLHTHPLGVEPVGLSERGGPRLCFQVEPDYSGPTQFYLQAVRNGQEMQVPFGMQIASPESATGRINASRFLDASWHMARIA